MTHPESIVIRAGVVRVHCTSDVVVRPSLSRRVAIKEERTKTRSIVSAFLKDLPLYSSRSFLCASVSVEICSIVHAVLERTKTPSNESASRILLTMTSTGYCTTGQWKEILPDSSSRPHQNEIWVLRRIRAIVMVAALCCGVFSSHVSAFSLDHLRGRTTVGGVQLSSKSVGLRSCLRMAPAERKGDAESSKENNNRNNKKKKKVVVNIDSSNATSGPSRIETELLSRMAKLEALVAMQEMEIRQLKQKCNLLAESAAAFGHVVKLLREAGLELPEEKQGQTPGSEETSDKLPSKLDIPKLKDVEKTTIEYFDDNEIFGRAPSSVIDAADAAGAAILAGMLGGKQRMLVDVRDAELSRDPETLVQFIELAILPVAAGLEGLKSRRNRVKIVFPSVSQLLEYRRTMALSAPEVVALSTLGFDPVETRDNIVVIVAPSPDDDEGLSAMNELLEPTDPSKKPITQPLVVLNYHMIPVSGPASQFEVAYHLRLLSVQFMTGNNAPEYLKKWEEDRMRRITSDDMANDVTYGPDGKIIQSSSLECAETEGMSTEEEDAALEAAMQHAHDIGMNQGVTRAMVIRAYPRLLSLACM